MIEKKKDWFLDELVIEMENKTGKKVAISTLWRALKYLGITRKKVNLYKICVIILFEFFFFLLNQIIIIRLKELQKNEMKC